MTRLSISCASPTCTATFTASPFLSLAAQLRARGWTSEQQAGDDTRREYCARCRG